MNIRFKEMLIAIEDMFDHPEIKVDCGRFIPRKLATELLDQVPIKSSDKIAVMNSPELVVYLLERGVKANNITLTLHEMCDNMKYIAEKGIGVDCKIMDKSMKFDVVIGNPPYSKGNHSSQVFWQNFALQGLKMLPDNGLMAMIHPSRWRGVGQTNPRSIGELGEKIKALDLLWLSIHDFTEGQKYFKAGVMFDMYVVRNTVTADLYTKIRGDNKVEYELDTKKELFIPNSLINNFDKVFSYRQEDCVTTLFSRSDYGTDKGCVVRESTKEYKYPCIYSISKRDGSLKLWYSNQVKKDEQGNKIHFGTPKVIFGKSQQPGIPYADIKGEYGMCNFVMGIVDEPDVLPLIAKAMHGNKFRTMMKRVQFNTQPWDGNIIKMLRKDFWKEFVTEDGELRE